MFDPNFEITPVLAKILIKLESLKNKIDGLPLTEKVIKSLRETAKLNSLHYSTMIEGNRLTQKEVKQTIFEAKKYQEKYVTKKKFGDPKKLLKNVKN